MPSVHCICSTFLRSLRTQIIHSLRQMHLLTDRKWYSGSRTLSVHRTFSQNSNFILLLILNKKQCFRLLRVRCPTLILVARRCVQRPFYVLTFRGWGRMLGLPGSASDKKIERHVGTCSCGSSACTYSMPHKILVPMLTLFGSMTVCQL